MMVHEKSINEPLELCLSKGPPLVATQSLKGVIAIYCLYLTVQTNFSKSCSESEKRLSIAEQQLVSHRLLEADFIETDKRLFEIHVGKVCAEKGLVLKPAADRFQKYFRQLFGEITGSVNKQIFLVRDHADGFFLPRPAGMGGNDFHFWKIPSEGVEVNGAAVVKGDAAAAIGIRSQHGKANVKHHRFAPRL